mmetsp:Transcript_71211/g.159394  ORF Transcript_71211/g.159394 Transcript_71211/m.159394 type:complete len:221 (+) Transcript_71211:464-1126(+)
MVPSGNQPASPPPATCNSNSFCRLAMRSLSNSWPPTAPVALKGTALWPIADAMVPMMGIFSKCEDTNILILACLAKGMYVTKRMVSMKEAWLETITAGRPDWQRVDRNSARPSMSCRTQRAAQHIVHRHMMHVKTKTSFSRKQPGSMGFTAPSSTHTLATRKAGSVKRTMKRLKTTMPSCVPTLIVARCGPPMRNLHGVYTSPNTPPFTEQGKCEGCEWD